MALKKQYQVFVDEMVKHGDEIRAYQKAYPKASKESARVNCYKLLQNTTISKTITEAADKIRAQATQQAVAELKDEIKGTILTRQEKQEILYKIAKGLLEIPVKKPVWDSKEKKYVMIPMIELPDHAAIAKAIEIDNKMTGDYAPEKWEVTKPIEVKNVAVTPEIEYEKLPSEVLKNLLLVGKKSNE